MRMTLTRPLKRATTHYPLPSMLMTTMLRCVTCLGLFPSAAFAVETALPSAVAPAPHLHVVPIDQEPSHRPVLQSDSLRVFDVLFPPGQRSLWHSHEKDSVLVCLDGADVPSEEPGKPLVARPPIASGTIYYRPYASTPFVHRIRNAGTTDFRILDIEVLRTTPANRPLASPYRSATVAVENERVRVLRLHLPAATITEPMMFEGPHLLIALSDGAYAVDEPGVASPGEATRQVHRGDLRMAEAPGPRRLRNLGHAALDLAIVEVK